MRATRRSVHGGVAITGGTLVTGSFLGSPLRTLVAGPPAATGTMIDEWLATTCWIGKQNCGILARRVDGRVIKLEGHPDHPRNQGRLCPKGVAQIAQLYDPNRVLSPLRRTNAKGEPGRWEKISWDEAQTIVAQRLSSALSKDRRLAAIVSGRVHVSSIYDTALRAATGIPYTYGRRGNDCGGPSEDAVLAMFGDRTPVSPDFRHCRYLICYWNLTQAGGPSLCQITYPKEVADARARGMKVVSIDPYARPAANLADEWVPVKPGTDLALWLAIQHVLFQQGTIDQPFLKRQTNAASLVRADGTLLKQGTLDLVWDASSGAPTPYGPNIDPALFGEFTVDGEKVKPALQVLKDHVQTYTPEWAASICGVPAAQIRSIGQELGQNAMIGSTIVIDGVEVPYRPVAYGIHGAATKFHSALQANRAITLAFMLLGAFEAAGGPQLWSKVVTDPTATHEGWLRAATREVPDRLDLGGTKWFPLGSSGYHMFPNTVLDPAKYNLPYRPEEMAILVHFVNPLMTSRPRDKVIEAWKRFGFVAVISPYLNETADHAADIVLPCGTMDKWEGPMGVKTLYESADTVRVPVMEPLGQSKSETEIYLDLCEKMGKLHGPGGYIDQINIALAIKEPYRLSLDRKPTVPQILDAWAQSKHGISLDEVRKRGVITTKVAADRMYLSTRRPAFGGVRAHIYVEVFAKLRDELQKRGVPPSLVQHYMPYPSWTQPAMERSSPEYDLYLMDAKRIEHKQSRTGMNPLLKELAPDNPLVMHATTAQRKGFREGDMVWVESHNPVTAETRRAKASVVTIQGIRPDTVMLSHHHGHFSPHPVLAHDEPNVNALLWYGDGFWDMGSGWFSHSKVRVYPA
jgi:sulfite dehydrogenase (quinone) subunit SoeA